jgi:hypothetical protein
VVVGGCVVALATLDSAPHDVAQAVAAKPAAIATISTLPSFGHGAEALGVDEAGTMIVGSAWDQSSLLHAVKWTLQSDGSWIPWPLEIDVTDGPVSR